MTCNVGQGDRLLRIVLGLIILGVGFYYESYWGLIGLIPLATGTLRWCPAYLPFHLSTAKKEKKI